MDVAFWADFDLPHAAEQGTTVTKVSSKKHKQVVLRLDPTLDHLIWESKQNHIIPIESIKELRSGADIRYYREQFQLSQDYEDRWLTITYALNGTYKTLHVIAPSREEFIMWDTALRKLHSVRQDLLRDTDTRQALWEKQCWRGARSDLQDKLDFVDVEKLCRRLHIHSNTEDLLRLFKEADTHNRDSLTFDDFRRFVKLLKARPEIEALFEERRARGGDTFDFIVFQKFMREDQRSSLKQPDLMSVFERYSEGTSRVMTLESFTSFLMSSDNSPFLDHHGEVSHDMTQPLPDYFISSSHNTYLVGHQLVGTSTIEGYIRALLHSCRSVELDIFDNDPIAEPMIFHGKTLTSKVPLRDVCHAIAKYGFVASSYPIIISAEMHCSVIGQQNVVTILRDVFGEMLVDAPINGDERGKFDKLPSPDQLKGRILFKTKNLDRESPDSVGDADDFSASATETSSPSDSDTVFEQSQRAPKSIDSKELHKTKPTVFQHMRNTTLPKVRSSSLPVSVPPVSVNPMGQALLLNGPLSSSPSDPLTSLLSSSTNVPSDDTSPPTSPGSAVGTEGTKRGFSLPRPKQKMAPSLLELLVYTVGVKCRGINKKEAYKPEHMFSLSETRANRMMKDSFPMPPLIPTFGNVSAGLCGETAFTASEGSGMHDLIKHCRGHLVRIYPKATRVSSTNFEPHRFWSAGIQLVAINWQTFDLGYMINHAMFQRNGRSGYILKPPALRRPNLIHPNETKDLLTKRRKHYFDVSVISAQQLPRPKDSSGREISDKSSIRPFVEVSMHIPDWATTASSDHQSTPRAPAGMMPARTVCYRTGVVKNNGFNPIWDEKLRIPFDCVGDMHDLVFVRFAVRLAGKKDDDEPLAVYCTSLGSLAAGYRHLPLHDKQLSQYLFSTLFVRTAIVDAEHE